MAQPQILFKKILLCKSLKKKSVKINLLEIGFARNFRTPKHICKISENLLRFFGVVFDFSVTEKKKLISIFKSTFSVLENPSKSFVFQNSNVWKCKQSFTNFSWQKFKYFDERKKVWKMKIRHLFVMSFFGKKSNIFIKQRGFFRKHNYHSLNEIWNLTDFWIFWIFFQLQLQYQWRRSGTTHPNPQGHIRRLKDGKVQLLLQ